MTEHRAVVTIADDGRVEIDYDIGLFRLGNDGGISVQRGCGEWEFFRDDLFQACVVEEGDVLIWLFIGRKHVPLNKRQRYILTVDTEGRSRLIGGVKETVLREEYSVSPQVLDSARIHMADRPYVLDVVYTDGVAEEYFLNEWRLVMYDGPSNLCLLIRKSDKPDTILIH